MITLSLRDRSLMTTCLLLGSREDRMLIDRCNVSLCDEIAGAVMTLTDMPLAERIQHAFEAQRLVISADMAGQLAKALYFDGLTDSPYTPAVAA